MRHDRVDVVLWFCTLSVIGSTSAADILPYRVVLFAGDLGPDRLVGTTASSKAMSRWPCISEVGDGLRFRIAGDAVFGNLTLSESGISSQGGITRAARWSFGDTTTSTLLPLPEVSGQVVGSAVADASGSGLAAGALWLTDQWSMSSQAACWTNALDASFDLQAPYVMQSDERWESCGLPVVDTWFTAVGELDEQSGTALAGACVASLGGGVYAAGVGVEVSVDRGVLSVFRVDAGLDETAPIDLDGDGVVNGVDLGIMITGWTGTGPGARLRVALACDETQWREAIVRYPYVQSASELLGFGDLNDLGQSLSQSSPSQRETVCSCVSLLASALAEASDD